MKRLLWHQLLTSFCVFGYVLLFLLVQATLTLKFPLVSPLLDPYSSSPHRGWRVDENFPRGKTGSAAAGMLATRSQHVLVFFFHIFIIFFFFTSLELSLKCSHIRGPNSFRAERDFPKVIQASIEQKPDPKRPVWIRNCGTPPLRKRFTYTQHLIRGKPIFALH